MTEKQLAGIRQEYTKESLSVAQVLPDALDQFKHWLEQALASEVPEATAMVLATAIDNRPSARVVLLKGVDSGFIFYTNYNSRKGQEIAQNPYAALTFFWPQLERQVRVEGSLEKLNSTESDAYFYSRPLSSQAGAIVSPQSQKIKSRDVLEAEIEKKLTAVTQGIKLERPVHWGGYRLMPTVIEFWQGRSNRLHDRLVYSKVSESWIIERLAP